MILAFFLGLLCGFVGSIPIAGPVAVLVFERGLDGKVREGLSIALGSAVAESFYAGAAFLGMTAFIGKVPWMLAASRVLGAVILIAIGLYFALRKGRTGKESGHEKKEEKKVARGGPIALGFVICILNPTLIVTWSGIVGILHSIANLHAVLIDAVPFGVGTFTGILLWFTSLLLLLRKFHDRLKETTLDKVVRGIGWLLVVGGVVVAVRVAMTWKK